MLQVHSLSLGMVQAYLLTSESGCVLVDAGMPGFENRVIRKLASLERDNLLLIYITHAHLDHYGSAAALRQLTGAPIAIHHADEAAMLRGETLLGSARGRGRVIRRFMPLIERVAPLAPTNPDILLNDGDDLGEFGLDAHVLHTPGHTSGSSSLIVENKHAFVGDLISSSGKPHPQRLFAQDWEAVKASLHLLQAKQPERIYPGHGRRLIDSRALMSLEVV